jgi:hypothetical protein
MLMVYAVLSASPHLQFPDSVDTALRRPSILTLVVAASNEFQLRPSALSLLIQRAGSRDRSFPFRLSLFGGIMPHALAPCLGSALAGMARALIEEVSQIRFGRDRLCAWNRSVVIATADRY